MKKRHYVMIVDDDPDYRETVTDLLTSQGYEVIVAQSGRKAIEQIRHRGEPCILLCDRMLPDMDGEQVVRTLREDPEFGNTTCVLVTGMTGDAPPGIQLLMKPFNLQDFLSMVENHCGGDSRSPEDACH